MGAPVLFGLPTANDSTASFSLSWPVGHRVGDLGILVIEQSGTDTTLTPAGWAHISGSPFVDVASTAGSKLSVLTRIAASSAEAAVATGDGGDHQTAALAVYRSANTITPVAAVSNTIQTTATTAVTFPTATSVTADSLVLFICSRVTDSLAAFWSAIPAGGNGTTPVSVIDRVSTGGNGGGFSIYSSNLSGIGATGSPVGTTGASSTHIALTLVISSNGLDTSANISTLAAEVLQTNNSSTSARVSVISAETLQSSPNNTNARITLVAAEVLRAVSRTPPPYRRKLTINGVQS